MNKKIICTVVAVIAACFLTFALAGCKNSGGMSGGCYYLQEAYDGGLLTVENLESIAGYHNGGTGYSEPLDESVAVKIKEIAAKKLRETENNSCPEARAEGFEICAYYGQYNGLYAVRISNEYVLHPADVPNYTVEIGGVEFRIQSYDSLCAFKVG